ncbi:MAG TPA: hypothetical protein DHN33_03420 [Eubacteriaceae bacterium]|nr:hypothetical protein [Eubacteriaceae bacterium]
MSFRIENGQVIPVKGKVPQEINRAGQGFQEALHKELEKAKPTVKMSAHATERMEKRDIALTAEDYQKIEEAMNTLEKKGAKESLLLYKDAAFIASIQNRTIITAMKDSDVDTVTQIDSAVKIK